MHKITFEQFLRNQHWLLVGWIWQWHLDRYRLVDTYMLREHMNYVGRHDDGVE
jgi:hypothetical protein